MASNDEDAVRISVHAVSRLSLGMRCSRTSERVKGLQDVLREEAQARQLLRAFTTHSGELLLVGSLEQDCLAVGQRQRDVAAQSGALAGTWAPATRLDTSGIPQAYLSETSHGIAC